MLGRAENGINGFANREHPWRNNFGDPSHWYGWSKLISKDYVAGISPPMDSTGGSALLMCYRKEPAVRARGMGFLLLFLWLSALRVALPIVDVLHIRGYC